MTNTSPWMPPEHPSESAAPAAPVTRPVPPWARVMYVVLMIVAGFLFGTVGSIQHASDVVVAGIAIPWGLIVALVGCLAIVVYLRLLSRGVGRAAQFMVGVVAAVALYTTASPGGTVLIQGNTVGWIWVVGCLVIGIAAVLWPRTPSK